MSSQRREQAGKRTGGQFATTPLDEADVTLHDAKSAAGRAVDEAYEAGIAEGIRRSHRHDGSVLDLSGVDIDDYDAAGATRTCGCCGGGGYIASEDPNSFLICHVCAGVGEFPAPGANAIACINCGEHPTCPVCGGAGTMAPTPPGRVEVNVPGHGTFIRADVRRPSEPHAIRLEADRRISDDEARLAAQLLGYAYASKVRSESLSYPARDSDRSFIVGADTSKGRAKNISVALVAMEEALPDVMADGSRKRVTDGAGKGTAGSRLVEGFGNAAPAFTVYYG